MKRPAVFIDRDGTINEQMGYINHISRFVLLSGAAEAIRLLNLHEYRVIITSNQSGVARGYFPVDLVERVHRHMESLLHEEAAVVDRIFFCPHHPRGTVPEYAKACHCRKPGTGMVEMACREMDIDLGKSYVIGDRLIDVELAQRAQMKGILVKTGYGRGEMEYLLPASSVRPVHIADDLLEAVRWITSGSGEVR